MLITELLCGGDDEDDGGEEHKGHREQGKILGQLKTQGVTYCHITMDRYQSFPIIRITENTNNELHIIKDICCTSIILGNPHYFETVHMHP